MSGITFGGQFTIRVSDNRDRYHAVKVVQGASSSVPIQKSSTRDEEPIVFDVNDKDDPAVIKALNARGYRYYYQQGADSRLLHDVEAGTLSVRIYTIRDRRRIVKTVQKAAGQVVVPQKSSTTPWTDAVVFMLPENLRNQMLERLNKKGCRYRYEPPSGQRPYREVNSDVSDYDRMTEER